MGDIYLSVFHYVPSTALLCIYCMYGGGSMCHAILSMVKKMDKVKKWSCLSK